MECQKRGMFLVVLALFLILSFGFNFPSALAASGCYTYASGSEDLYCVGPISDAEASVDCEQFSDCSMNTNFISGSTCQDIPECEVVTCSVDCQSHALGACQSLGGEAVSDEEYAYQCNPGCCKIQDRFCQFNLNKYQCEDRARRLGINDADQIIFDNRPGMSTQQCNQLYCQVAVVPARLQGIVQATTGEGIPAASLVLEGTRKQTVTGEDGL